MRRRRPGHREGVPRFRREGQLSLVLPSTLAYELRIGGATVETLEENGPHIRCVVCDDRGCEFCPKVD